MEWELLISLTSTYDSMPSHHNLFLHDQTMVDEMDLGDSHFYERQANSRNPDVVEVDDAWLYD